MVDSAVPVHGCIKTQAYKLTMKWLVHAPCAGICVYRVLSRVMRDLFCSFCFTVSALQFLFYACVLQFLLFVKL